MSGEEACVVRGEDSGEDVHSRVGPMERTRLGTRTWTLSLPLLSLTSHLLGALCLACRVCMLACCCTHTLRTPHTHTHSSRTPREGSNSVLPQILGSLPEVIRSCCHHHHHHHHTRSSRGRFEWSARFHRPSRRVAGPPQARPTPRTLSARARLHAAGEGRHDGHDDLNVAS